MSKIYGGRYEIVDKIGAGGMAIVYKAKDILLNRIVAVKVLREQFTSDEGFVRRFRREAQSAASLSHHNIVSIFDVGKDGDEEYIVMEYVKGQTLKDIIREQAPLNSDEALNIVRQIAEALAHAHANHIVHRDIKPQNILITDDGRIKVTDFGIARAASSATLTHTGDIVGSVHYLSPEQAKGTPINEQSDIYSLGIILYEMVTGKVPFDGDTPITIALKHVQEEITAPGEMGVEIAPEIEIIIRKALAKSTEERYKNALELLDDLDRVQAGQTISYNKRRVADEDNFKTQVHNGMRDQVLAEEQRDLEKTSHQERKDKKKPWKAIIGIGVVIILLGLAFGLWRMFNVPEVRVPDLTGLTLEQAEAELKRANLILGDNPKYEFSDEFAPDLIIDQSYKPHTLVKAGRVVDVTLSKGPEFLEVPNVMMDNLTEEDAKNVIRAAGFEGDIIVEYRKDPFIPQNRVIDQDPKPGSLWHKRSAFKLVVSSGKEFVMGIMPDVTAYYSSQAKEILEAHGYVVRVKTEPSELYPIDTVIRTIPLPGQSVKEGSKVTIFVSKGPGPLP
ncbi:MAG: Stk1 family PASTA domain-containing Ser/Thr kinase [Desulfitobacteriia bacterium]